MFGKLEQSIRFSRLPIVDDFTILESLMFEDNHDPSAPNLAIPEGATSALSFCANSCLNMQNLDNVMSLEEIFEEYRRVRSETVKQFESLEEVKRVISSGEGKGLPVDELSRGYLEAMIFLSTTTLEERERIANGHQRDYSEEQNLLIRKIRATM